MPKFLVINAEAEAHIDALVKSLADPSSLKRFETKLIDTSGIIHTIRRALEAAFHGDNRISFENIREGWAFSVKVTSPSGHIRRYRVRVQEERR